MDIYKTTPYHHQRIETENHALREAWGLRWQQGCVDASTEYLSREGWRRMDEYDGGDVAQWCPDTGQANFVRPSAYVVLPCVRMIRFKTHYGVDQLLSREHRVPILTKKNGNHAETTAFEIMRDLAQYPNAFRRLPSTFHLNMEGKGVGLSEMALRIQIAVFADGHFASKTTKRCYIRLKKPQKIARMRELLQQIAHDDIDGGKGYRLFRFSAPIRAKQFPSSWWKETSNADRDIILDEIFHWDGSEGKLYFSRHKSDADFVQFLVACSGGVASIGKGPREKDVYIVCVRKTKTTAYTIRNANVTTEEPPDGKKYCFEVPTSFLLFRRRNCIFPSGNTGKSKTAIDHAVCLYRADEIDRVMVVAPNGVHHNWVINELPLHCAEPYRAMVWSSKRAATKAHAQEAEELLRPGAMPVLCMSYDGFMTTKGRAFSLRFVTNANVLGILDESQRIKTPGSKRSKALVAFGKKFSHRRILSGTPLTRAPMDLWPQIRFLDPTFWARHGFASLEAFKTHFAIFQERVNTISGRRFQQYVAPRNLEELADLVEKISSRVTKDEVLDLPPKVFQKVYFTMKPKQQALYDELRENLIAEVKSGMVDARIAVVKLLHLRRISCGHVCDEDLPDDGRMDTLRDLLTDNDFGKTIIFACFTRDIEKISAMLGDRCVRYYGKTSEADRVKAVHDFQDPKGPQFFVGNPAACGVGLTLTAAETVIYHSNSFNWEDREQSEDRAHRLGQHKSVTYIDLIGIGTPDNHILMSLRAKKTIATIVNKDELLQWI